MVSMNRKVCFYLKDSSEHPSMECLDCAFYTTKTSHWKDHLKSRKHRIITGHVCRCDKIYASKASLRRHEKTCDFLVKLDEEKQQSKSLTMVVDRLAHEIAETNARAADRDARHAAEVERLLHEIASRPQVVMNNTNCTFNLATFLNETCKHAPSIEQFMNTVPICLDAEKPIGQYIVDQLARCAVEERPIHCTDVKRCKLAVKQENEWVQDPAKIDPLMTKHIHALRFRCLQHLNEVWCRKNPDYEDPESTQSDEYQQFILSIMGDLDAKFLNHVAKVTPIPKN